MRNEKTIWDALLPIIGNPWGVAGLMGNLQAESGLEPVCLEGTFRKKFGLTSEEYTRQVDEDMRPFEDGAGYGLAQWTYYSHKRALLALSQEMGQSVGSLAVQIEFLRQDIQRFSSVLHVLQRSLDVRTASDDVLCRYERPADQSETQKAKRAAMGETIYQRQFAEGGTMDISNTAFCGLIQQALAEGWGYIWGKYGQTWTQKDQDNATNEMAIKYGAQWIGKRVADCSGLIYWAFRQLGGTVYHGSNTMWNEYVYGGVKLENGKRADGGAMWPGDPVFIYKDGRRTHVGIYVGGGVVIEAQGTRAGVVSNKNNGSGKGLDRWSETAHWKGMLYVNTDDVETGGDAVSHPTLRKGSTGDDVKALQELLNGFGYGLTVDGIYGSGTYNAVKDFQQKNGLTADGIAGTATWAALEAASSDGGSDELEMVEVSRVELEALRNTIDRWLQ